jgi:transcriptional regulator with XRE-family HTH domain
MSRTIYAIDVIFYRFRKATSVQLKDRLREVRQKRGVTLLQVAEAVKLSVSYLSDLERGRTKPSLDTLERLAAYYEMSVADLVSGIEGWGTHSIEGLAPGIIALLEKKEIDEREAQDLNRIELRGKRPQTEEEWRILYQNLQFIMRPYLNKDETKEKG